MNKIPVLRIDTFKKEEKSNDFYANNIASHCTEFHNSITIPHKHDFYVTVLFTNGSGTHEIDFNTYEVKKGSVFMLKPGQIHHWELSDDVEGIIFVHTESFYDLHFTEKRISHFPFFCSIQNSPQILLDDVSFLYLKGLFESILSEYMSSWSMNLQKIRSLIDISYIELTRNYFDSTIIESIKTNLSTSKIYQLEQLIDQHFNIEKSPKKYAEWMNMSARHLNRIVQAHLNKTTHDLITERVILEAKRLLINSTETFYSIALQLGYEEYPYFSRIFKKKCLETPSQFQNKYLKR